MHQRRAPAAVPICRPRDKDCAPAVLHRGRIRRRDDRRDPATRLDRHDARKPSHLTSTLPPGGNFSITDRDGGRSETCRGSAATPKPAIPGFSPRG